MALGTSFEKCESPCPKDAPCQISMHPSQWFMRRRKKIFKCFCFINVYKTMPLRAWSFVTPETLFEQNWISLPQGCSKPIVNAFRPVVHEKRYFFKIYPFFYILPLIGPQKWPAPLFEQIWIPILQACFSQNLVEIGQVLQEKILKVFAI